MTLTLQAESRPPAAGFTLLEVLLVLVILAFASALIVPNLTGIDTRSFSAQVREATSVLNYSRRTAVVQGYPMSATLRAGSGPSTGAADSGPARRQLPGEVWTSRDIEVSYRDSTNQRVDVQEAITVTFYPEGGSSGGELTLRQGERVAILTIDPFSGRVNTRFNE